MNDLPGHLLKPGQFVLEFGRLWPEGVALSIITIAEFYEGVPSSRIPRPGTLKERP